MVSNFTVLAEDHRTRARLGRLRTGHGEIDTPVFMPVGTVGTVKAQTQEMLEALGVRIILSNTYHLYLRPGHEVIGALGGLHRFISWPGAILTDSGGFQIFSLAALRKVSERGYEFRSHLDGSPHLFTPELAVEVQWTLGSDVIMPLDVCTAQPAADTDMGEASARTVRWARRCRERFDVLAGEREIRHLLFGIGQGGTDLRLRRECLAALVDIGFDGYAIGGLAVGESKDEMYATVEAIAPEAPSKAPRYLMGVGTPADLVSCVGYGVDMFDCVMPTRNARNGQAFTGAGPLNIKNAAYARDAGPIDEGCSCPVCARYSRAYLRHLYMSGEILASILCTQHNLSFYLDTMKRIRQSLKSNTFADFAQSFLQSYRSESGS
ncbi:MAG: tRNA guanosine(34) transglycosylase Tgt [Acidobacteria bacterium]|nr:tRNA guanosine(34) transglycosylase Tgt [Acidobacteriota bacterium]